jgi:hypothetical protein
MMLHSLDRLATMPCPSCGSHGRTLAKPGFWTCTGGSSFPIPAGWSNGPGLTNPMPGNPVAIYHEARSGWEPCRTTYAVDYRDLSDDERVQHDAATISAEKAVIAAEVDARLPGLPTPDKPSALSPEVNYLWLSGLVGYWLLGTLVLWGVLAGAHSHTAKSTALTITSLVLAVALVQWWRHHAGLKAAHKAAWKTYEAAARGAAERTAAREQLRTSLWSTRPGAAETENGDREEYAAGSR